MQLFPFHIYFRRGIRSGLCAPDHMSLEDLVTDADDKLFNLILYSKHHVLHSILPDRSDFKYNLRPRRLQSLF